MHDYTTCINRVPLLHTGYVGYIVQVTSRYSVKISNNTRIKLFGVLGRTGEQELKSNSVG